MHMSIKNSDSEGVSCCQELIGAAAPAEEEESRFENMTPSTPGASRTVLVKGLPLSVNKSDVIEFFEQAGEVVYARNRGGSHSRIRGGSFWYVEYATEEAAKKALELDRRILASRTIVVTPIMGTGASKTLCVKNLSCSTTKSDVIEFFKEVGEIADVRFSRRENGSFRGVCHIEFATDEAAKKATEFDGEYLLGRPVKLGFVRETIYIRGFDTSPGINQIRSSLEEHFSTCGKILWMHVPTIRETDAPQGIAFIEFLNPEAFPKALAMNGHKLGDSPLTIEDAEPLYLSVRGTGNRKMVNGGRSFSHYGGCVYPFRHLTGSDRGWGGAGIGKRGSPYNFPSGKKTKFDDD